MNNLNDKDTLASLISILFTDYNRSFTVDEINNILSRDGYTIDEEGRIISSIGEIVELKTKLSDIEAGISNIGSEALLTQFKNGVKNYGEGANFQDIRNSIEGVINIILTNKNENINGLNMRRKMELLLDHNILRGTNEKFSVNGQPFDFEFLHSYGIWKMLSHYIDHFNESTGENERHFVFFQSIGLLWLIIRRV